jgi:hypothetical protein
MADLSPYEMRVLRQMATGGDEDLICGAALWAALETLEAKGLTKHTRGRWKGVESYEATKAGRALFEEASNG